MDDRTVMILLGIAVFICFSIALTAWEVRAHCNRIRECLSERGATEIDVSWQWAKGDRSNNGYIVGYTNRQGKRCQAACKVARFFTLSNGDIYWSEPPEV